MKWSWGSISGYSAEVADNEAVLGSEMVGNEVRLEILCQDTISFHVKDRSKDLSNEGQKQVLRGELLRSWHKSSKQCILHNLWSTKVCLLYIIL